MKTSDTAKRVREILKKQGYKAHDISVRSNGCSVDVNIKNPCINIDKVSELVKGEENVRYCEHTQEILQGGNTFVFVAFDWQKKREIRGTEEFKGYLTGVSEVISTLEIGQGKDFHNYTIWKMQNSRYMSNHDNRNYTFYGAEDLSWSLYLKEKSINDI